MKKLILFLISLCMLMSCQKTEDYQEEYKSSGIEVVTDYSYQTRAGVGTLVKKILYIVTQDGVVVDSKEQNTGDSDFGKLSMDLQPGDYQLMIYATSNTDDITIKDDGTIEITKCSMSYSFSKEVTIAKNKRSNIIAELTRCNSRININSLDDIPITVKKFKLQVTGNATEFNIFNNKGLNKSSYTSQLIDINSFVTFNIVTGILVPEDEKVDVILWFYDSSGNVLYNSTLADVPVMSNRETIVSAALFHEHGMDGNNISINETWGESIEIEY